MLGVWSVQVHLRAVAQLAIQMIMVRVEVLQPCQFKHYRLLMLTIVHG
jgi:hypothetical protein